MLQSLKLVAATQVNKTVSCHECSELNSHLHSTADLPTFYEIKAEDLPTFGKKRGRFLCSENIAIFYPPVTQNEPIFPF